MSLTNPAKKPAIPVAKPAGPKLGVKTRPEPEDVEEELLSPVNIQSWAWSIGIHAVLLIVLACWYFSPETGQVKQFDTRLAGSEFGVEDGLNTLGGLDTPISMPEAPEPNSNTETTFAQLPSSETVLNPSDTGFKGGTGENPGAGLGDGFGLAKFGQGGEDIRGVAVKVGDPQFTLLWDSTADIDIHVMEPGGKEIYWEEPRGKFGGELDVDNTVGFGPENVYWLKQKPDGSKDLGPGPPGEYKWFVHYYGGNHGVPVRTRWKVRVKHAGKVEVVQGTLNVPGARSKIFTLKVGSLRQETEEPK